MENKKTFDELICELTEGLAVRYNANRADYPYENIKSEQSIEELEKQGNVFSNLLEAFQKNYIEIFNTTNKEQEEQNFTEQDKEKYLKIGELCINIIQNLYLNPINYRLNQLNNRNSLRFAWIVAIASVVLATASILLTWHYGKNPTPCSCHSTQKSQTENVEIIET